MKDKIINLKNKIISFLLKHKKISIITLIIVLIIIAIIICVLCTKTEIGNTNGNLNNVGFTTKNGKWIYYQGYNNSMVDGIYKSNGTKTEKILDNYGIYLNNSGKYIFFVDAEDNSIKKIKNNGKNIKTIVEDIDIDMMTVIDNWIYYFDDSNFYKIKTNGKDKKILLEKTIENYQIVGNWIYYSYRSNGNYIIAKMKTNGENNTKIDEQAGKNFFVDGNKIYYIYEQQNSENNNYSCEIYKLKTNGKNKEKIADISGNVNVDTSNYSENFMYYTKRNDDDKLAIYKIDLKQMNETKIVDINGYSTYINVYKNWIYYPDQNDNGDIQMFKVKTNGENKQNM